MQPVYVSIQQQKTGERIRALLTKQGLSVRDVQTAMGFENPQAVYKWLSGKSLPSLDNLVILSRILHTHMEDILVLDGDVSFVARKVYALQSKNEHERSEYSFLPERTRIIRRGAKHRLARSDRNYECKMKVYAIQGKNEHGRSSLIFEW